ncbi:hypothetical protein H6P81_010463 [Aristolochia fimbriata]|uniref:Uncharacterized protein n=1 Tax=Aristolochia fimbriata TaxID=158543 RepID=A0AAV7ETA6_ARIFI|nr:hypothetical protein H6P81_010463 [Aristolochia fimbriata]
MYFDGAARRNRAGTGVLFVSPRRDLLPYSFVLTKNCSNNETEYQAILLGLGMVVEMKLPQLNIYGDSALVIKQLTGEFEVKKPELVPFWRHAGDLLAHIPEASLHYVPRSENGPADALAGIAASLAQFDERPSQVPICKRWVVPSSAEEETEEEHTEEIEESLPISASQNAQWETGASRSQTSFATAHSLSTCESESKFAKQLQSTFSSTTYSTRGYTKVCSFVVYQKKKDSKFSKKRTEEFAERTKQARSSIYKSSDWPPEPLHPTIASWPFEAWGMDIIGPITPKSDSDKQYILAATDYFSKWAEATAYQEVKETTVADFIRTQIIYRYGVPRYIVTNNSKPFRNRVMDRLCEKFHIQQRTSSAYNPAANRLAEAFNKTLCKILKKTIGAN